MIIFRNIFYAFLYDLLKKVWVISKAFSKINDKIIGAFSIKKAQGNTVKNICPPQEIIYFFTLF